MAYTDMLFADCVTHDERESFIELVAYWAFTQWPAARRNGQLLGLAGRISYFRDLLHANPAVVSILMFTTLDRDGVTVTLPIGYTAIYPELTEVGRDHFGGIFSQYRLNEDHIHRTALAGTIDYFYFQAILLDPGFQGSRHLSALLDMAKRQMKKLGTHENRDALIFAEMFDDRIKKTLEAKNWAVGPERSKDGHLLAYTQVRRLLDGDKWTV